MKTFADTTLPALALAFGLSTTAQANNDVQCGPSDLVDTYLQTQFSESATGIKGSSEGWNFEIYGDNKDGSWTIVGKREAAEGVSCLIAGGETGYPDAIKSEPWYPKIFAPGAP